jgi:hypothetical protein
MVATLAGSCQERCHPLDAFYASFANVTWRFVCWVANGSFIHTKSGSFQQRIDVLQRLGFAIRASSYTRERWQQISIASPLWRCWWLYQSTNEETHWQASSLLLKGGFG